MKATTILSTLLGGAALAAANPIFEQRAACNADNCARAVTGQAAPPTSLADCSSFMQLTVTPSPIWSTVTVDSRPPIRGGPAVADHAVTIAPTDVPAYATPCSGVARYSSACNCAGAPTVFTTMATPTHTIYQVRSAS